MAKTSTKETITPDRIEMLKKKHGDIFEYEADGMSCILKRSSRTVISAASTIGASDPLKFAEVVLENCWVEGNDTLRTDDRYFLGLQQQINQLVEIKVGKLKKL